MTREPYVYARDNPTNAVDPTGLDTESEELVCPLCLPLPSASDYEKAAEEVSEGFEDALDDLDALFGNSIDDTVREIEERLHRLEVRFAEERDQCPIGEELKREGEELLGRGHSDAGKARWKEWWGKRSKREKKAYNEVDGPKAGKRNRR